MLFDPARKCVDAAALVAVALTALTILPVGSFASAEPLLQFDAPEIILWTAGSGALITAWLSWVVAYTWAVLRCPISRWWLTCVLWAPVNAFYLYSTATGAVSDIQRYLIDKG